ncbi:MAG: helix-turn-helix domain-containing protein [bacterium]
MPPKDESWREPIRRQYPPILTTAQVAELLGLNVRTVMAMANDGRLEASRLPGSRKYHFFLENVLDALAQHRVGPEEKPAAGSRRKRAR